VVFDFQPITAIYFIGVVISTVLTVVLLKRRPAPGATAFALFNLAATWWVLSSILEYGSIDIANKIFWAKIQCIGILSSGMLWFIFSLEYTGHSQWKRPLNLFMLNLLPLVTLGLVLTNEQHGLYWSDIYFTFTQFGQTAIWEHGWWFWVSAGYQYLLVVGGVVFLIKFARNKSRLQRKQLVILILGASAPLAVNLIYLLHIKALEGLDFTPLSISLAGFIFACLIFQFHFLDVNSLARNAMVEQIPEGILVLNTEGLITDMNPAAEKILGFKKSKALVKPLNLIWPELDNIKPSFQNDRHQVVLFKLAGQAVHLDVSITGMKDGKGRLCGELLMFRDITAIVFTQDCLKRKVEIEETLTRISSRFVGDFDYQKDVTASLEDIGRFCGAGRAYLFNLDPLQNTMCNTHEWCADKVLPQMDNLQNLSCDIFPWWMAKLRRGEIINVPVVRDLPLEAAAERDILSMQMITSILVFPVILKGELSGFIGLDNVDSAARWSDEDVAILGTAVEIIGSALERLQAATILENRNIELSESEEYQRKLLSSLLTGVITVDARTHQIVDINEYGCQLFGASREEIVGHRCHRYICPSEVGKCPATDLKQLIYSSERQLVKADGTLSSIIKSVFWITRGKHDYLIESITDIEPLKKAQSALMESEQRYKQLYEQEKIQSAELEKESRARANFIDVLTHELKTPLTPLLASMEMLQEKLRDDQESIEARLVRNAMIGSTTLNKRLNELLDLAKLNNGTFPFDYRPVAVGDFIQKVSGRLGAEFQKRNQLLVTDIESVLPVVQCDPVRLERALAYLLDNASKSSKEGYPVILRVKVDDHQLLIDVEDHGATITDEEKQRLFEPYHRVEQDRQRFSGLGLGFAITKQIINAHGGWIQLESEENTGNKFKISIPLEQKSVQVS